MAAPPTFSSDRLRGHRHGQGCDPADVAAAAGCTVEELTAYETGRVEPSAERIAALAEALHIPVGGLAPLGADPTEDYVDAVIAHLPPLGDEDLAAVAWVMRPRAGRAAA